MPINNTTPVGGKLGDSLKYWYETKRKVTYEFVDLGRHQRRRATMPEALAKFCKIIPSKVNLIQYNPIDEGEFRQAKARSRSICMCASSNHKELSPKLENQEVRHPMQLAVSGKILRTKFRFLKNTI